MSRPLAGLMFEEAAEYALRDLQAFGSNAAVRTTTLAKAMRRLGCQLKRDQIVEKLWRYHDGKWGRQFCFFIGGSDTEFDSFVWAIPHGE